jgi:hypothetical protein
MGGEEILVERTQAEILHLEELVREAQRTKIDLEQILRDERRAVHRRYAGVAIAVSAIIASAVFLFRDYLSDKEMLSSVAAQKSIVEDLSKTVLASGRRLDEFSVRLAWMESQQDIVLLSDDDYRDRLQSCVDGFYGDRRRKYFVDQVDPLGVTKVNKDRELLFVLYTDTASAYGALLDSNKVERLQIYILISRHARRNDEVKADYFPGKLQVANYNKLDVRPKQYRPLDQDEARTFDIFLRRFADDISVCVRKLAQRG